MAGMRRMIGVSEALSVLAPGSPWVVRDNDYDKIEWFDTSTPMPSREAVEAKIAELEAGEPMRCLREVRDWYLQQCDWTQSQDIRAIRGPAWCAAWDSYRQQLRDITNVARPQFNEMNFLVGVEWPAKPEK